MLRLGREPWPNKLECVRVALRRLSFRPISGTAYVSSLSKCFDKVYRAKFVTKSGPNKD